MELLYRAARAGNYRVPEEKRDKRPAGEMGGMEPAGEILLLIAFSKELKAYQDRAGKKLTPDMVELYVKSKRQGDKEAKEVANYFDALSHPATIAHITQQIDGLNRSCPWMFLNARGALIKQGVNNDEVPASDVDGQWKEAVSVFAPNAAEDMARAAAMIDKLAGGDVGAAAAAAGGRQLLEAPDTPPRQQPSPAQMFQPQEADSAVGARAGQQPTDSRRLIPPSRA